VQEVEGCRGGRIDEHNIGIQDMQEARSKQEGMQNKDIRTPLSIPLIKEVIE